MQTRFVGLPSPTGFRAGAGGQDTHRASEVRVHATYRVPSTSHVTRLQARHVCALLTALRFTALPPGSSSAAERKDTPASQSARHCAK